MTNEYDRSKMLPKKSIRTKSDQRANNISSIFSHFILFIIYIWKWNSWSCDIRRLWLRWKVPFKWIEMKTNFISFHNFFFFGRTNSLHLVNQFNIFLHLLSFILSAFFSKENFAKYFYQWQFSTKNDEQKYRQFCE